MASPSELSPVGPIAPRPVTTPDGPTAPVPVTTPEGPEAPALLTIPDGPTGFQAALVRAASPGPNPIPSHPRPIVDAEALTDKTTIPKKTYIIK